MIDTPENEDDKAAAEWAAMIDAEDNKAKEDAVAPSAPVSAASAVAPAADSKKEEAPTRVLNQDEIDTLLGFDSKATGQTSNAGIHAILDRSLMAYEKLPMLEIVFDRMVRSLSSSLRNFTSDNVDVSLESMTSLRFEDYLNSIPLPAMIGVFRAVEWENLGLVTVDSSQIYSTVDVLLGGRRSSRPIRIEGRPYTTIEQDIVKRMIEIVLGDMSSAFDPISPITFQFDRIENNPRFAAITRPNNAVLLIRLRVDMDDRGGVVELMLPHATLEPIRDLLLQIFMGEKFGQDTVWEKHLGKEVRHTDMQVEVILDEKTVSLGDIVNFKVGSTILLNSAPDDDVIVRCGGVPIATGKLGRMGDHIAVSIQEHLRRKTKESI